jgi:hypothetical protein
MKRKGMSSGTVRQSSVSKRRKSFQSRRTIPRSINFTRGNNAITKYSANAFRKGEEVKTLDVQFTGTYAAGYTADTQPCQLLNANTGTACVQSINLIQQGAGISQRIGNKVSLKSVRLRFNLNLNAANVNLNITNCRMLLVYDRNPNGGYLASNAILGESLQSNTIGTGTLLSNLNPNYFDRYVILMDKLIPLPPWNSASGVSGTNTQGDTSNDCNTYHINEFIKLKNLECQYNGTANPMTIAYQNIGSLQLVCFGDTAAASQPWGWIGTARLRFRDN